jgi:hypothetical protein
MSMSSWCHQASKIMTLVWAIVTIGMEGSGRTHLRHVHCARRVAELFLGSYSYVHTIRASRAKGRFSQILLSDCLQNCQLRHRESVLQLGTSSVPRFWSLEHLRSLTQSQVDEKAAVFVYLVFTLHVVSSKKFLVSWSNMGHAERNKRPKQLNLLVYYSLIQFVLFMYVWKVGRNYLEERSFWLIHVVNNCLIDDQNALVLNNP